MRSLVHILFYLCLWSCYLFFPPFFPVACLSIWKIFILHHFKDKRWNSAVCTLSNLAEYTGVPSNFVSRAHQGFVSQLKRAVSHRAADNRSVSRQLKMRRGTEKSVLKKKIKKKKLSYCDDHSDSRLPWQRRATRDPWVCRTKSALHGNRQVAGDSVAGDSVAAAPRGAGTRCPTAPTARPGSAAVLEASPEQPGSSLASQQAFTNKSKEAINTCISSGACTVNTKAVKA